VHLLMEIPGMKAPQLALLLQTSNFV